MKIACSFYSDVQVAYTAESVMSGVDKVQTFLEHGDEELEGLKGGEWVPAELSVQHELMDLFSSEELAAT